MEPVSLAFAALGTADLCIKYGNELVERYQAFRDANDTLHELVLRVEDRWLKTNVQIEFLRGIWSIMEEQLRIHQNKILQQLQNKLCGAAALIARVVETEKEQGIFPWQMGTIRRFKFAAVIRDHLKNTIDELDTWHAAFDPSWWIIIRMSNPQIDQHLIKQPQLRGTTSSLAQLKEMRDTIHTQSEQAHRGKSIFLAGRAIQGDLLPLSYSRSLVMQDASNQSSKLVDRIRAAKPGASISSARDVRNLAQILSKVDPDTFGLLSCDGVIKTEDIKGVVTEYDFIFSIPSSCSCPRSLRDILLNPARKAPLNERFSLASRLSRSVFFMHASNFVHKSIRPDNVVVFEQASNHHRIPFLVGFERFRTDVAATQRFGDDLWEHNIYRHPQRQGLSPDEDFSMQHDIYSLGVVLLEVGLSVSFLWPGSKPSGDHEWIPNADVGLADLIDRELQGKAKSLKKKFIELAKGELPSLMGLKYTQVVISCLTCLDRDNEGFGDESEFEDEDGILVGVRFIEKVLIQLDGISL